MFTTRVYGRPLPDRSLAEALKKQVGESRIELGDYTDDSLAPEVLRSDLLLCFIDESNAAAAAGFIGQVVRQHGAWGHLPALVVGLPDGDADRHRLDGCGAAGYLPREIGDGDLAQQARRVIERTQWHVESCTQLPVFLVDASGIIIRANHSARKRFGVALVGQPYCRAVEGQEGELPEDHPIARATDQDSRMGCADHKFRRADGRKGRYFLSCRPMLANLDCPRFVLVELLEISHWETLIAAPARLRQAKKLDDLYERIVRLGEELGVRWLAFSPDGKTLVSGSYDSTARLWSVADRKERAVLQTDGMTFVAYTTEGKALAVGQSTRGPLSLWDVARGNKIGALARANAEPCCLALSPDGKTLASGDHDGAIAFWDVIAGKTIRTLKDPQQISSTVRFYFRE